VEYIRFYKARRVDMVLKQNVSQKEKTLKMQTKVQGQGDPIVLVPGGLTGWLSWNPHVQSLRVNRKTIQVQLLNVQYGLEQSPLPSGYSVKMESRALKESMDELGFLTALDIMAWSFGGEVTLDYALDNPSRVRSLVLIEPPAYWALRKAGKLDDEAKENEEILSTFKGDVSEEKLEQFARVVGLIPPGQPLRNLPQWPLWVQHRLSLRNNPAVIEHDDELKRLRSFEPPVLLVKGTGSAKFLHQIIDVLAAELPHARITEMPAGHAPHIVSMDRFLKEVAEFQNLATA
jgi:pimeloyl-ACP methyl ester carboxylesterase